MTEINFWQPLADAIAATGTNQHIDRLIDSISAFVPHDLITVTRYSASSKPEFVKHRRFSDEMVRRYLDDYYVYDPFYAYWRQERRPGILPLRQLASTELKRGKYMAEFLAQSRICDEIGIMLADGEDWCLGIFLDRTSRFFRETEIRILQTRFPVFQALHETDLRTRSADFRRTSTASVVGDSPRREPIISADIWPELSPRERELVQLILAGHPTAAIAEQMNIAIGTVKNHRRRIYDKLDITTERELFLQFFQHKAL
ncbi:Response regulator containing a CheY-like receiver domain and an HTH DNA-binding domain [Mesorhizobium sp. J18]|uniref:helix-turn-helix transcriptional regulator n=1 Tax=Mesorhizobium sp. J18 TaxID=935263 RepID=UPI00119BE947|nr:helix-turn-helix transcriptional regulator [Mesorhizobium sp. J18]TWG97314.1 Response regulator containing a CheY-like receiver domain and an HTH DNA-binding domain [Mesorhizobium sp. J18]